MTLYTYADGHTEPYSGRNMRLSESLFYKLVQLGLDANEARIEAGALLRELDKQTNTKRSLEGGWKT